MVGLVECEASKENIGTKTKKCEVTLLWTIPIHRIGLNKNFTIETSQSWVNQPSSDQALFERSSKNEPGVFSNTFAKYLNSQALSSLSIGLKAASPRVVARSSIASK